MDHNHNGYLTSAAHLAYLVCEHARLELKKLTLAETLKDKDLCCECRTEGGTLSLAVTDDYVLTMRQLDECARKIQRFSTAVLPAPRDRRLLRPGLRARLRQVDRGGRPRGAPIQVLDVGLHAEYYPSADIPIVGAACRQILPFIDQPRGFCAEVPDFDRVVHRMKLVGIERTPVAM